jgi:hypothetical protein
VKRVQHSNRATEADSSEIVSVLADAYFEGWGRGWLRNETRAT